MFLYGVEQADLPVPETNIDVEGVLVDAAYVHLKLLFELDGGYAHSGRVRQTRDRPRRCYAEAGSRLG